MSEAIKVQRHNVVTLFVYGKGHVGALDSDNDGAVAYYADVAPLLAELAHLRERARMRYADTEPPRPGQWVIAECANGSTALLEYDSCDWYDREPVTWWPLPEVSA